MFPFWNPIISLVFRKHFAQVTINCFFSKCITVSKNGLIIVISPIYYGLFTIKNSTISLDKILGHMAIYHNEIYILLEF